MWTPIRLLQFFQLSRHFSVLFYAFFLPFLGFSKAEIGSFELLQILAFSFSFFWVSGLIQGLMIVYPSLPDKQKRNMLYNAFLFFIFISFISLTILLICIYLKFPGFQYFSQISFLWIFLIESMYISKMHRKSFYLRGRAIENHIAQRGEIRRYFLYLI
jgi:signal transduction histidine kinase